MDDQERIDTAARLVTRDYPDRVVTGHGWVDDTAVLVSTHNARLAPEDREQEMDSLLVLVEGDRVAAAGSFLTFLDRVPAMRAY